MSTQNGPSSHSLSSSAESKNNQYAHPAEYAQGRIPWALQPRPVLCHSEQELKDLQAWRHEVKALVNERIAAYATPHSSLSINTICELGTLNLAGSRLASITELVEQILRYAHPVTRLIALGVCKRWRDIALYLMDHDVCLGALSREPRCPPVRLHDVIPETFARPILPPDEERGEIDEFFKIHMWNSQLFAGRCQKDTDNCDIITTSYLPARISQNQSVEFFQMDEFDCAYVKELSWIGIIIPEPPLRHGEDMCQWTDLSQFELNPLFTRLFDDQIPTTSGIAEVTLPSGKQLRDNTGWQHIPEAFLEHLNSDFFTEPPIVSLNISIRVPLFSEDRPRPRKLLCIFNVKNEGGIRVSEVLSALKKAYTLAIEYWIYWARLLHAAINEIHWSQDIWVVDSAPRLFISIGSEEHPQSAHHLACTHAIPCRDQRQAEWMPESIFKHGRQQPGDGKYSLACEQNTARD